MWAGFALTAATGILLFVADATRHASNPAFLMKLVFVLLVVTALALTWTRVFRGGRIIAAGSICLWIGVIFLGRFLPYLGSE